MHAGRPSGLATLDVAADKRGDRKVLLGELLANLFVRRDHWGAGLAHVLHRAALDAAGERGFSELRLFVAAGQARARRFYEREGWLPAGEPFDDPIPGLTMIEYRYSIRDRYQGPIPRRAAADGPLGD